MSHVEWYSVRRVAWLGDLRTQLIETRLIEYYGDYSAYNA